MVATLAELMLYTTVKLTGYSGGAPRQFGTGFFWSIEEGDRYMIALATNKHVIDGCNQVLATFHSCRPDDRDTPNGPLINMMMELQPEGIINHPDAAVDLCALGFSNLIDAAESRGNPLFMRSLNRALVPDAAAWGDFDAIEDVLMVGYPNGLADEVNNMPIVRRGITATALSRAYQGRDEFLVDMACFPGSSGSPVFIKQIGFVDRATGSYQIDGQLFISWEYSTRARRS